MSAQDEQTYSQELTPRAIPLGLTPGGTHEERGQSCHD